MKTMADLIGEITAASDEQALGVSQVNEGLSQIDIVTQRNAAHAEETSSASMGLSAQATQVRQIISRFKIRSTAGINGHENPVIIREPRISRDPSSPMLTTI